jgi:hypothetical protein
MGEISDSVAIFVFKDNVPYSVVSPIMETTLIIVENWRVTLC